MAEEIPRRMKRFYRKGRVPPQGTEDTGFELDEAVYAKPRREDSQKVSKEITQQLVLNEVKLFKKEHKRLPKKEEYDKIAESIYTQLKDKEKRKKILERLDRLKPKKSPAQKAGARGKRSASGKKAGLKGKDNAFAEMQAAAKGLSQKDVQDMSVQDLFSNARSGKKAPGSEKGKFSLGEMPKFEEKTDGDFSLEGLSSLDDHGSKPSGSTCPNCGKPTDEIVFCSECGTAFCEKCTKRVSTQGSVRTLVCPGCGKKTKK